MTLQAASLLSLISQRSLSATAKFAVLVAGPVRANNGRMLVELAALGAGIVLEPDFIVEPEVQAGRLRMLLPGFEPPRTPIAAVYPSRRHLSSKVRAFVDYLAACFARDGSQPR